MLMLFSYENIKKGPYQIFFPTFEVYTILSKKGNWEWLRAVMCGIVPNCKWDLTLSYASNIDLRNFFLIFKQEQHEDLIKQMKQIPFKSEFFSGLIFATV